ncbi:unnamed protein product, partial [Prorocentrum cordatum]
MSRNFVLRFGIGRGFRTVITGDRAEEIFVGLDRTKQDIARERACKQLKTSLSNRLQKDVFVDREAGTLLMQWQPIAKVEVHPSDPPTVRRYVASLADLGLERAQLASAADHIFSRVPIQ